jgi:hypothetical protein
MLSQQREDFAQKISEAFQSSIYPIKNIGNPYEVKAFVGKKWQEVTVADINTNHSLFFFSDAGLQYFLPAYLIAVLRYPEQVVPDVQYNLLQDLGRLDESIVMKDRDRKVCEGFTDIQKLTIIEFLEKYEQMFPFVSQSELEEAESAIFEQEKADIRRLLQKAIDYWKNCQ